MSVAVYLRNFIRQLIGRMGGDELTPAFIQRMMDVFYTALISRVVELPVKRHLYLVFESLITVYLSQEQNLDNLSAFYGQLFTSIQTLLVDADRNIGVTKGALMICQAALQSIRNSSFLNKVFTGLAQLLCKLADDHLAIMGGNLMEIANMVSQGV